jgi:hypothetical protein
MARKASLPLSKPHELGRAIGYNVGVELLLNKLRKTPSSEWDRLSYDRELIQQVGIVKALEREGSSGRPLKRLWVVLKAEGGIPVMLDAYRDKPSATRREKFLRQHMRPEQDQVRLFKINV